MSSAVMVYAVKLTDLSSVLGSRRRDLMPDGAVSAELAIAYRELVDGSAPTRTEQDYVDAFELICRQQAHRSLPNSGLAPTNIDHFDKVNRALAGYHLGFDLMQVVYGGVPLNHPVLGKSKSLGHVAVATLVGAAKQAAAKPIQSSDALVDEALSNIESWLMIATAGSYDIVGFFY